jgi:hypothetical protein
MKIERVQQAARPGGLAALMLAALVGCGGGDALPREAISGTVSLDGQPLKEGVIQFMPAVTAAGGGTVAGGSILDGKFDVPRDQGPTPGPYSVTILSGGAGAEPLPPGTMPGEGPTKKPAREKIPAKYNAQTTLTAEVKKGGPNNAFKFDLTTK